MPRRLWVTQVEPVCLKDIQQAQKLANGYQNSSCQAQTARRLTITLTERVENL